jgi:hypothetical protein
MKIKKSSLTVTAAALVGMVLASPATAFDGVMRDVTNNSIIPNGTTTHYVGWMKYSGGLGSFACHVTINSEAAGFGSTANVTAFTIPSTALCSGSGFLGGCQLETHSETRLPYYLTVTSTDFDLTSGYAVLGIEIHEKYKGLFCPLAGEGVTLTFSSITLTPLKTGTTTATGTSGKLGGTANTGEPIAGVEISGNGSIDREEGSEEAITVSGELEVDGLNRCTWKLATS